MEELHDGGEQWQLSKILQHRQDNLNFTINVSKFLPASNCSKKTCRNQIIILFTPAKYSNTWLPGHNVHCSATTWSAVTQCTTWTSLTTTLPPQTMQQLLHTRYFLSFSAIYMKSVVIKRALIHLLIAQACHSFTPNSSFVNLYHPRFSNILLPLMIWLLLNVIALMSIFNAIRVHLA